MTHMRVISSVKNCLNNMESLSEANSLSLYMFRVKLEDFAKARFVCSLAQCRIEAHPKEASTEVFDICWIVISG